jgi:hypothetical protein
MANRPLETSPGRTLRASLHGAAATLVSSSLILYLAAVVAQRTWVVLNSDIGQLLRRLH